MFETQTTLDDKYEILHLSRPLYPSDFCCLCSLLKMQYFVCNCHYVRVCVRARACVDVERRKERNACGCV